MDLFLAILGQKYQEQNMCFFLSQSLSHFPALEIVFAALYLRQS